MVASSFRRGIVGPMILSRDLQPIKGHRVGGAVTVADDAGRTGVCTVCTVCTLCDKGT